ATVHAVAWVGACAVTAESRPPAATHPVPRAENGTAGTQRARVMPTRVLPRGGAFPGHLRTPQRCPALGPYSTRFRGRRSSWGMLVLCHIVQASTTATTNASALVGDPDQRPPSASTVAMAKTILSVCFPDRVCDMRR